MIYRVRPGVHVDLAEHDASDRSAFPDVDKAAAKNKLEALNERLRELQELFAANASQRLLIVLQAMDTGGKDGTIRNVFSGANPVGMSVASFKAPSDAELARDYLWRVHREVPHDGHVTIFNRSHYEDVLIVRVHGLVAEERWRRRFDHINAFERMLADEGTTILKFFLHISRDEQRERLQARLDDPHKRWKFRTGDLAERARWDDYMGAYQEALSETSTEWAPWYVVPANRKWYRDLVVSSVIVEAFEALDMRWPEPEDLNGVVVT